MKNIRNTVANSGLMILLAATWISRAPSSKKSSAQMTDIDRAIVLAVSEEDFANHLEKRTDVCVGFSTELDVNRKAIVNELKQHKLGIHPYRWCNKGPVGLMIFVGPVAETSPGIYEISVTLGDNRPIQQEGAHFATLVRRGKYIVKSKGATETELISYEEVREPQKPCASGHTC